MIPFNNLSQLPAGAVSEMHEALDRVLASGHWILGGEVERFERLWAATCGAAHAVGTGNGLDAIEIALRAAGIGPGDEVITTPMTALATILAITRAEAVPVLADIDPRTALLDPESIQRCVGPRTRALIPVHLYGNAAMARKWADLADQFQLILIEDCAQAHLASLDGRSVGTFGVAGAFSFYPTKNLGALGDAGALITCDEDLADTARRLRNYGQRDRYHHEVAGLNSRLDELQAALLQVRLQHLAAENERRVSIAAQLRAGLTNPRIELLDAPTDPSAHVYHLFVIRCEERNELARHLQQRGVGALIHYPIPAHLQPPFLGIRRDPHGLAASERHAAHCLSLPCNPTLSDDDVAAILDAANAFCH